MENRDKEEFEKRIDVVCNKENDYERFFAIWQVAVEYKQQEIDELKDKFRAERFDVLYMDKQCAELKEQISKLKKEIEYLRRYGNKDCLAMADEALQRVESDE